MNSDKIKKNPTISIDKLFVISVSLIPWMYIRGIFWGSVVRGVLHINRRTDFEDVFD